MAKLILLPGLGANRLLFEPQRHFFDQDLFVPDWLAPMATQVEGRRPVPETLADYAHRYADRWLQTVLASPEKRRAYWIGGVSFGGQLALEAADRLVQEGAPPKGVFLIAASRTAAAIPSAFKLKAFTARLLGPKVVEKFLPRVTARFVSREELRELDAILLRRVAEGVKMDHLLWGMQAASEWTYADSDWKALTRSGVKIHQIHGEHDWVIPLRKEHADRVVPGGRHLINITHADEVNRYIESKIAEDLRG